MGLAAERPSERLQMSSSKDVDLQAEAERIRREQRMFMKVPGSLTPIGKMEHEKAAVASQVRQRIGSLIGERWFVDFEYKKIDVTLQ